MSSKQLVPLYLVTFIGALGYSIVMPFLVFLVTRFGGNELIYGLMGATYPAFQLVGAPLLGAWSDRVGRRKILFASQAGTLVSWIIFLVALYLPVHELLEVNTDVTGAFAITVPLLILFAARAFDGLTGGNISVANAYLADVSTDETRKQNFGRMAAASNLGFILGPAIAGVLGATLLGETLPVMVATAVSVTALVVIAFWLPESKATVPEAPVVARCPNRAMNQDHKECYRTKRPGRLGQVMSIPHVPFVLGLYFLIFLGFNFFYTAFPLHAVQSLRWSITDLGWFFSLLSGLMVIMQGPVLSRISERVSDETLTIAGSLILAGNFVLLSLGGTVLTYGAAVLFAVGNGLMWPSFQATLARLAGPEHQGAVQGFASSAGSLASILGLVAGGLLYSSLGTVTFVIAGGTILLVFALSFRLLAITPRRVQETVPLSS